MIHETTCRKVVAKALNECGKAQRAEIQKIQKCLRVNIELMSDDLPKAGSIYPPQPRIVLSITVLRQHTIALSRVCCPEQLPLQS